MTKPRSIDHQYESLLAEVLEYGAIKQDRTHTGTRSLFGKQLRYDLAKGFPLITTKFVPIRLVAEELFWFLRGESNIKSLVDKNVHIWDEWADEDGSLGPVYGVQWRAWPTGQGKVIDQIAQAEQLIKTDPNSRRIIVSAWNVSQIDQMALAPCHAFFQFYVVDGKLSCMLTQRSADMFLGVPFNIASYALLTHMMAQQTGLQPGELIWSGGDCHVYLNHVEQARLQLSRYQFPFPTLKLRRRTSLFDYEAGDVGVLNYEHHPAIKGEVAV